MRERTVHPTQRLAEGVAPKSVPVLGENGGFSITQSEKRLDLPSSPIIDAVGSVFSLEGFSVARTPLVVGKTSLADLPEEVGVSDMIIKGPGLGYRVPNELSGLRDFLTIAATAEEAINPDADKYYAYLTTQRTKVSRGEIKRNPGAHSDSIQGRRIQPKRPIEHGFTVTDHAPTRFFTHAFDLKHLDPDKHWLNAAFEEQKDIKDSTQFTPGEVVLFDAYSIHEAIPAEEDKTRTFVRLIYSVREFDRAGNTENKLFPEYKWDFQPRPVPSDLIGMPQK